MAPTDPTIPARDETPSPHPSPQVPAPSQTSPKAPARSPVRARLTLNETAVWQPLVGPAIELVPHRVGSYIRLVDSDDQTWTRDLVVGKDWQPLDLGWLGEAGKPAPCVLFLANQEGQFRGGIPTAAHRAEVLGRVIEVGIKVELSGSILDRCPDEEMFDMGVFEFTRVRPYESCRFEPYPDTVYMVRCPTGPAKATVIAAPGDGT